MSQPTPLPAPLTGPGQPVDWLFVFKFNSSAFPGCNDDGAVPRLKFRMTPVCQQVEILRMNV